MLVDYVTLSANRKHSMNEGNSHVFIVTHINHSHSQPGKGFTVLYRESVF